MTDERPEDRLAAIETRLDAIETGRVPGLRTLANQSGTTAGGAASEGNQTEQSLPRRAVNRLGKLMFDVAPGLILFGVGYVLIQSVQLGLEQEKFQADSASKVREFVQYLYDGPVAGEPDRRRSTAIALGTFGRVAVVPLILIMEENGVEQINAARVGLISAGRVEREHACEALGAVVRDATRAYHWETQKNVAEALGLIGCGRAAPALDALCTRIAAGQEAYNRTVRKGVPDKTALRDLGEAVARALIRVGAAQPSGRCAPV